MEKALAVVKDVEGINASTGNYQITPVYTSVKSHRTRKIHHWEGTQQLVLEGTDQKLLGKLTAKIQPYLVIKAMSYGVSPDRYRMLKERLLDEALARFQQRAERIAQAFGKKGYELVSLQTGGMGTALTALMANRRQATLHESLPDMGPASIAAGKSQVSVEISGLIELR